MKVRPLKKHIATFSVIFFLFKIQNKYQTLEWRGSIEAMLCLSTNRIVLSLFQSRASMGAGGGRNKIERREKRNNKCEERE